MDASFLAQFLLILKSQFVHAASDIRVYALALMTCIIMIELARKLYKMAWLGEPAIPLFTSFFLRTILLIEAFLDFPNLVSTAYDYAVHIGVLAGGAGITFATFQDPGSILGEGLRIGELMLEPAKQQFSLMSPLVGIILFLAWLTFMVAFTVMAVTIFFVQVELIIAVPLLILSLPFSICGWTAWMAQGVFSWLFRTSGKCFILAMLASVVPALTQTIHISTELDSTEAFLLAVAATTMMALFLKASSLASGILSGHPQLAFADSLAAPRTIMSLTTIAGSAGASREVVMTTRAIAMTGQGIAHEVGHAAQSSYRHIRNVTIPRVAQSQLLHTLRNGNRYWRP